jgi:hypothetical protein
MRSTAKSQTPRWYSIPGRVVLVTFLVTLLSFAVSLLISILGLVLRARLHGTNPDMRFAYRAIAFPIATVVGSMVLVLSTALEVRHYRQSKTLAGIVRASR